MELSNTVSMMESEDYKERFKAEYYQIKIRICKLDNMLNSWDAEKLNFTPTCPRGIYDIQIRAMREYKTILEIRAITEGIDIDTSLHTQ